MSENGLDGESLSFTVTSSDDPGKPHRFVLGLHDEPIKIGRYKKNQLTLTSTGVSWVHLELKRIGPGLGVKDLSSNGVGLKAPYHDEPKRIEKGVDVEVEHGSLLVLPFKVSRKEKHVDSPQTTLTVEIDGGEVKKSGPVLVTLLGEAPVGGLGAPLLGAPKIQLNGDSHAAKNDEESPTGRRSRSRSRSRGKDDADGGEAGIDGEPVNAAEAEVPVEQVVKKKEKRRLAPGVMVRIKGLQARGELNGKVGTIIEFDQAGGFWKVRMEDGTGKAFRQANLALAPQKERLDRVRAFLQEQEDEQNDLANLCREVLDAKPPPDEEAPPPPPDGVAPAASPQTSPPPPPDAAAAVQAPLPPPSVPPAPMLAAAAMPSAPMGMTMGMPAMMPTMPHMQMAMPAMMPMPTAPMGMPMTMGFPAMGAMGMQMPMMGMGMANPVPPAPPVPAPAPPPPPPM